MKKYYLTFREIDKDKFDEIVNRQKTIETRAATNKYRLIKTGDVISFACGDNKVTKQVIEIEYFNSLDAMFASLPLKKILPSAKDLEDARAIYYSFPGYKEKIEVYGIIAFHLSTD